MKYLLPLLFIFISFSSIAKDDLKIEVFTESVNNEIHMYASNAHFCPASVMIDFQVSNLALTDTNKTIYSIPAFTKKLLLAKLKIIKPGKPVKFSYSALAALGDAKQKKYDENFPYFLPYNKGESYFMDQGYNGQYSHRNENALDFSMPIGTEVRAIREGIVVAVIEDNTKGCKTESCKDFANSVTVYHPDGTFVDYIHLKHKGAAVKVGDKIRQGGLIGYSGNTGWSTGPHLHIVVYLIQLDGRTTLKTKFLVGEKKNAEYLEEKKEYKKW